MDEGTKTGQKLWLGSSIPGFDFDRFVRELNVEERKAVRVCISFTEDPESDDADGETLLSDNETTFFLMVFFGLWKALLAIDKKDRMENILRWAQPLGRTWSSTQERANDDNAQKLSSFIHRCLNDANHLPYGMSEFRICAFPGSTNLRVSTLLLVIKALPPATCFVRAQHIEEFARAVDVSILDHVRQAVERPDTEKISETLVALIGGRFRERTDLTSILSMLTVKQLRAWITAYSEREEQRSSAEEDFRRLTESNREVISLIQSQIADGTGIVSKKVWPKSQYLSLWL
jgi:hypothetical protein